MIFPSLTLETTLQVDDKTRFDASRSFDSQNEIITDVEIRPSASDIYYSVSSSNHEKWFLDWAYETDGMKTVSVRVTTASGNREKDYSILVLTEEEDALFSNDNDLFPYEPNILKSLPRGKSSFIYAHRAAQKKILAYLDEHRIWKDDRTRFRKEDIVDLEEFSNWSMFQTLLIIFESGQVSNNDIFQDKVIGYTADMKAARNRASIRLDKDGDGINESNPYNIATTRMVRR